ncbi:phage tail tip fiber protein, partial [Klebsiella variicola]|uniref:phage tail tip fiber protein n=11 Tax=Klebsiella pneumoniae complex TaxID=3390273 RepID=UPI000AA7EBE0
ANVASKADQTAMNSLTGRVEKTESGLTAANSNITSLSSSLSQQSKRGANLLPDGTFESYAVGHNLANNRAIVTTDDSHGGNKCIRVTRPNDYNANATDNTDTHIFSGFQVRDNAVFYMECWVKLDAKSTAMAENVQISVGLSLQYQDNSWQWPAVTKAAKDLSSTQWTKVSGYLKSTKSGIKQAMVRISIPNVSSVKAGNSFLIDDLVITEVTDAYNAQSTADANANAISTLNSTVSQQGDQITSQGNSITKLTNDLATTNNNVSNKADANALTALTNRVTQTEKDINSTSSSVTNLNNKVDSISVGGTNLIKNSGDMTGWSNVTSETYRGNAVIGATVKAGSGYRDLREITLESPVDAGEYVYSFYAKGGVAGQTMTAFFYNPNTTTSIETSQGAKGNNTDGRAYFTLTTSWVRYWVKWKQTPTTGTKRLILCRIESNTSKDQTVYINSPKFEVGNVVSDWNDSPADSASASAVDLLTTTVNQQGTSISSIGNRTTSLENGLSTAQNNIARKADASALQDLRNTVTSQGGNIDSLSSSITALENSLRSTNDTVSKKADTTAVSSLTGRVSQVENTITSQSQSITSLTSSINTISTQGANPWVDGTFESYGDGHVLGGGGTAVVVASQKFTGNKSLQVSRGANNNGNSDKQLGSWQSVREDAKFRFEFWAMMPADQAPSSGWTTLVGINSLNAAGQNSWQSAVTVSEAALGARDKWVKFTGIASNNGGGRTRAVVWISTRGASGSGTPGYSLYIDDLVITDVTDAKAAQDASDATASAVSGLTARVTDAEGKITAQAQQQTALATKVDNANSRVDNMAKTLSDSQSTQASLNTSLQSQIDAQAAANIKNQTTLDNTIKSVASITSTQQTHATALEALATQQTTLTSSVGDLSASVQNTAKTVADVNGTVSSLWSMKVETVNGKNVGAGITLGSNGETSDMILYADRFSLFNRNNATAVPVMVAEGNELYIDTARIKNSSLTSAKIADGSITNAKIGNEIRSNNFVDGSQGWRIAKDGSSQFNNVIVRGRVEANSGVFRGTVQADSFIGDIAVAKSYDSLTFRRNQTVQRNGAYQNRGYSMTVVLACTLVCQTYGTGSGLGYTSDITFNIGGQEVTRRIFVDAGNITGGTTAFELRFAARLDADYNNVGFFIRASGRTAAIDYTCTVENITATAFRTDSSSFS